MNEYDSGSSSRGYRIKELEDWFHVYTGILVPLNELVQWIENHNLDLLFFDEVDDLLKVIVLSSSIEYQ